MNATYYETKCKLKIEEPVFKCKKIKEIRKVKNQNNRFKDSYKRLNRIAEKTIARAIVIIKKFKMIFLISARRQWATLTYTKRRRK